MTEEARRDQSNGIWLCQSDGKLVDSDGEHFTIKMLRKWKKEAERLSFEALAGLAPVNEHLADAIVLDDAVQALVDKLDLTDSVESVTARMLAASNADLAGFVRMPGWPAHPVTLNLHVKDDGRAFKPAGLAAALETFKEFTVVAPPGTGKTTTLLQVMQAVNANARSVALFVPLGEWSSQPEDFLQNVRRRPSYAGMRQEYFALLAHHGRLVLALDGWNELDFISRRRATAEVRKLQREFPELAVIFSTRRQALDVPIGGATLEIDLLNEDQQLEIARALRGQEGEALLDHAWRTHGVRELIAIPLYLTALLSHIPGDAMPTTKEEVLRLFVEQHERRPEQAQTLREALFGFHPQMLVALASDATHAANTTMSDTQARAAVSRIETELTIAGQMTAVPQPSLVLDVLVSQHTLVRSDAGTVSFQHQQFQEWYASFEVERVMREAATGDMAASRRLRGAFLDQRAWEESILFASERVSRGGADDANVVSTAVLSALSVEPVFAARMIFRSAPAVWDCVRDRVIAFVDRWHKPGTVDRAVRFMVSTGRPEFSDRIWPLVESPDSQIHLSVLRAARRFHPGVLGANPACRLACIPDPTREHVLSELAMHGNIEGIRLATDVAKTDLSPAVQLAVFQALQFRRADRQAVELLAAAAPEVWPLLARGGYVHEIADVVFGKRLHDERKRQLDQEMNPLNRVSLLLQSMETSAADGEEIGRAIQTAEFSRADQDAGTILHRAFERYPLEVAEALVRRLEAGKEMPLHADEMLSGIPSIDDGPVAALALAMGGSGGLSHLAAGIAGPVTVGKMLDVVETLADRITALDGTADKALSDEYHDFQDRIAVSPTASFTEALLARQAIDRPHVIGVFSSLIPRHGSDRPRKLPLSGDPSVLARLVDCLRAWTKTLLSSASTKRHQMAHLATAIGRVGDTDLVEELKELLNEDLGRRSQLQAAHRADPVRAPIGLRSDASTSWTLQYREAFSRLSGAAVADAMREFLQTEEFGFDAACVLKAISERGDEVPHPNFSKRWPDFSTVTARRVERRSAASDAQSPLAEMIFAAIGRLTEANSSDAQQRLAIMESRIAFSMPHGDQTALAAKLMALPQPAQTKREMLAALVLDGEIIPADRVMEGIHAWIGDGQRQAWRLTERIWEIEGWLELLPFTDRPLSIREGIELVYGVIPERPRIERVVTALSYAPNSESDALLVEMARTYPELTGGHEWAEAFLQRATVSAALSLIDFLGEGRIAKPRGSVDIWWTGARLAALARTYPELRSHLILRYETAPAGIERQLIERTLQNIGDLDCVRALVQGYARSGRPFDGNMYQAVRHVAHDDRAADGWAGAITMHPVPLTALRKELFGMIGGSASEAELAVVCLETIDTLRDYFGAAEFEPRHPDIESGRPWPSEAGVVTSGSRARTDNG